THYEHVLLCAHEAGEGVFGCADDWLAAHIETCVDNHRAIGQALERGDQIIIERIIHAADGLHARRIINVRDGGNRGARDVELRDAEQLLFRVSHRNAMTLLHGRDQEHVRRVAIHLEVIRDALAQDRRRERAERFAELDLQVHLRLHLWRARVAEDGARTERTRAKLHAPLKPTDDLLLREQSRDVLGQFVMFESAISCARRVEISANLFVRKIRAEVRAAHAVCMPALDLLYVARVAEILIPSRKTSAQRAACIARRRLNPNILKRPFAQNAPVADAVQSDAARETQVSLARLLVHVPRHAQHRLFDDVLDGARQVHLALRELAFGLSGFAAEQSVKRAVRHRETLTVVKILHVEAETAVRAQVY